MRAHRFSFACAGLVSAAAFLFSFIAGCGMPATGESARPDAAPIAFRNAVHEPPPDWTGPVFELSHDYPTTDPGVCPPDVCTWLALDSLDFSVNFDGPPPDWYGDHWNEYIMRILDYVKEGQPDQLDSVNVTVGGETRWFHVPWMAYDPTAGREFVHGTTNERTAHLSDFVGTGRGFGVHMLPVTLSADCARRFPHGFETWAVGVYNPWGGYALGQAWPESGAPDVGEYLGVPMPRGLPFPEGTLVAKFLFTNAPVDCVPFLRGSPEWQVNRHKIHPETRDYLCEREVQTSRLVQVDVAVVDAGTSSDPRSPTRWVYGTFAYNGNLGGATVWDNLAPVGVQWGSDPWTFPAVPQPESIAARQSVLNPDIDIFEHDGCNARLAGPVDNSQSSCISCHASSYAAPGGAPSMMGLNAPATFGFDGLCTTYSQENVDYFQNVVPPQSYHGGQFPDALNLDTSLQMWVAFTQYGFYHTDGAPQACINPDQF